MNQDTPLTGPDYLDGDSGVDELVGGPCNDLLLGGNDNDNLAGNAGHDALYGNNGNDALDGGAEDDFCLGGPGSDTVANCEGLSAASSDEADIDKVEVIRRWQINGDNGADGTDEREQQNNRIFLPLVKNKTWRTLRTGQRPGRQQRCYGQVYSHRAVRYLYVTTAPNALRAVFCASVIPVTPVIFMPA